MAHNARGKHPVRANGALFSGRLQAHALPCFPKMCDVREVNKHIKGEARTTMFGRL
ncbi:MAG: hypothetical protein KGJ59_13600 [Bacteroidota bacterium]|nr:hypothetical protein [Bacteroidota bacterium]